MATRPPPFASKPWKRIRSSRREAPPRSPEGCPKQQRVGTCTTSGNHPRTQAWYSTRLGLFCFRLVEAVRLDVAFDRARHQVAETAAGGNPPANVAAGEVDQGHLHPL